MVIDPVGDNFHAGEVRWKLKQEHLRVIDEEERLATLTALSKKGLSTRDILAFARTQADLRTINKGLDKGTSNMAMRTKIRDCRQVIRSSRKSRSLLKKEFLMATGGKKYELRKFMKKIRPSIKKLGK